jgi:hypothetical protein
MPVRLTRPRLTQRGARRTDVRLFDSSSGRTAARRTDPAGRVPGKHADEGRTGEVNADRATRGHDWPGGAVAVTQYLRRAEPALGETGCRQAPLRRRRRRISYSCTIA